MFFLDRILLAMGESVIRCEMGTGRGGGSPWATEGETVGHMGPTMVSGRALAWDWRNEGEPFMGTELLLLGYG